MQRKISLRSVYTPLCKHVILTMYDDFSGGAMYVTSNANPAGSANVVNRVIELPPVSSYSCVRYWW